MNMTETPKEQIFSTPRSRTGSGDYTVENIEDLFAPALAPQKSVFAEALIGEPQIGNAVEEALPESTIAEVSEPAKPKLRAQAQEKIESILNLRTFAFVAGCTVMLALYIYNVISMNRLATETQLLGQSLADTKNLNSVLESNLNAMQRIERISTAAFETLELRVKGEQPIELPLKQRLKK
ncbi:MAG: hypothetical protein IAF08_09585 [Rhizobacter sp.]|nr:hypothetical protein [Chlorobiales bacterium]